MFLWELTAMAGKAYHLAILKQISWRDLQQTKIQHMGVAAWQEAVEDEVTDKDTTLTPPVERAEDEEMLEESGAQ